MALPRRTAAGARQAAATSSLTRQPELTWRLEIVTVQGAEGERLHQLQRAAVIRALLWAAGKSDCAQPVAKS